MLAEAAGKHACAATRNAYGPLAMQRLMCQAFAEQLPKVVEAAARPLTQVKRVIVFDSGTGPDGARGLDRYATQLPSLFSSLSRAAVL
ncbi:MAG: flotillin domain-containing protein [Thermomicrobium sp.]